MKTRTLIKKIMLGIIAIAVAITFLFIGTKVILSDVEKIDQATRLSGEVWNSELAEIKNVSTNNVKYVDMALFVDVNGNPINPQTVMTDGTKDYVIVIGNGLEMYYFGEVCNSPTYKSQYLTFHYVLGDDIDYNEASMLYKFIKPIGWGEKGFQGIFDGQGFVISNLFYAPINNLEEYAFYEEGSYSLSCYSLFAKIDESGIVRNVGLKDVIMLQPDKFKTLSTASSFIGENFGTVSHVYLHDFRGNASGLTVEGGFFAIAGLMVYNYGVFTNSYVAINRVVSESVSQQSQGVRFAILYENMESEGGVVSDVYYDSSILIDTVTAPKKMYIDPITSQLTLGVETNVVGLTTSQFYSDDYFPYYRTEGTEQVNNGWFSNITYPANYHNILKLTYPILQGLVYTTDINEETYFAVSKASDLVYMTSLIARYGTFRREDYRLINSIDATAVTEEAFYKTSAVFSGNFQSAEKADDGFDCLLQDGSLSPYNSIFNMTITKGISYNSYRCYGFFEILAGTVKNINFVDALIRPLDLEGKGTYMETNAIGIVTGKQEGGLIENVNVNGKIILTTKANNYTSDGTSTVLNSIGLVYAGGLVGYSTLGTIKDCTTTGIIDGSYQTLTTGSAGISGSSIGGIIGKINRANSLKNCLNSMNIYAMRFSSSTDISNLYQYIGGVVGSGITNEAIELENDGNIVIGVNGITYRYGRLYAAGVFGLHTYGYDEIGKFLNNGNITMYVREESTNANIAGVINIKNEVDASTLNYSSLSSRSVMNIINNNSLSPRHTRYGSSGNYYLLPNISLNVAGVAYTTATNTNINGAYNFAEKYVYNNNQKVLQALPTQEIDISILWRYAPCVVSDNEVVKDIITVTYSSSAPYPVTMTDNTKSNPDKYIGTYTNLKASYNYRNINYVTSNPVNFYNLVLSGNTVGLNFNLDNIRNDGDIVVNFTKTTQGTYLNALYSNNDRSTDYKKLKVFGCFEEVSINCKAKNIFNGGDIEVTSNTKASGVVVVFNVYASGICYKNANQKIFVDENLSVDDVIMDPDVDGTIHNCVNNGDITIRGNYSGSGYTNSGEYYGVCRAAGITAINASILSSCFNLGNILNINYIIGAGSYGSYAGEFEVETGGICFLMLDQYAQIKDSANNGSIYSICTSAGNSWVNAGGIIVRNEKDEFGVDLGSGGIVSGGSCYNIHPHKQKIEFSINYGDVFAYNGYNDTWTTEEPRCKAAGFLCLGVNSVVNVVNYGDIFATKVVGGMYGLIFIYKFVNYITTDDPVYIANAINYGDITPIQVSSTNLAEILSGGTNLTINSDYLGVTNGTDYPCGALIGYIASNTNYTPSQIFNKITVSYLINFVENVNILGRTDSNILNVSNLSDAQTMQNLLRYMATTKEIDYSPTPFAAGTTDGVSYGIKSYYKDTRDGIVVGGETLTEQLSREYNGGIFNQLFPLRDTTQTDPSIITNQYIADYIQFVPYSKVNEHLIDEINLKETIMLQALQMLLIDLEANIAILDSQYQTSGEINTLYNSILSNHSAIKNLVYANADYSLDILESMYASHSGTTDFEQVLQTLLSNASNSTALINAFVTEPRFITLLTNILNDANVTAAMKVTMMNTLVNNSTYLASLANYYPTETGALVTNYLALLESNPTMYAAEIEALFTDVTTLTILNSVVDNLSATELQTIFASSFGDSSVVSDTIVNNLYSQLTNEDRLAALSDSQVNTLYTNILNDPYINDSNLASLKNSFNLSDNGKLQLIAKYNGINYTSQQATFNSVIDDLTTAEATTLWNTIKNSATMTADVYNSLGTFYLRADSSNNFNAVNPNYGYSIYSSGNTVYTAPYQLTGGSYENATGVYTAETPAGTTARRITYMGNNNTSGYYRWRNNGFQYTMNWSQRYYRGETNVGYVYYTTSGNYYYYHSYGSYFQYSSEDNYASFINATLQADTIKYFLKTIFYNQNQEAAMREVTKALYASTSMSSNLESHLLSLASTLSIADKREIITVIYNAYSANLSVTIPSATTRADKIKGIATKASGDGSYYHTVLHDSTNGIDDYISSASKLSIVESVLNNESGGAGRAVVLKEVLPDQTNKEYYLARALSANATFFKDEITALLGPGLGDSKISSYNMERIIDLLVEATPSLFNTIVSSITLNDDDKLAIVAEICYYDAYNEYTDPNYTGSNILVGLLDSKGYGLDINDPNDMANLTETLTSLCAVAGLDIGDYTDSVGIYALASSDGIEEGQFLPDNVMLIYLDEYLTSDSQGNPVNDATWRGGSADDVNNFYVLDENGDPTTELNTACVNYRIYYMMKQLKKSIATTVFKIELEGTDRTNPTIHYTITNNVQEDYNNREKEITFYVASNADEANASSFLVNLLSNYELSYNAIFKEGSLRPIVMGTNLVPGDIMTSKDGGIPSYTFIVQAEDRTVETEYFVNIIITAPKTCSEIIDLRVNGGVNYAATPITNIAVVDISGGTYDDVASVNGSLLVTYTTKNLPNGLDMKNNIKMYHYADQGQTIGENCIPANLVTNYSYASTLNNGRVVVETVGDSAFNEDYTWDDGTLIIDLDINSQLNSGIYILEFRLTQEVVYYVVFEKAMSSACSVELITFDDQPFLPAGASSNIADPVEVLFGTQFTKAYFTDIDEATSIPSYLSAFNISPLATYEITNVTVDETDPAQKVYNVNYLITAENGINTSTFTHIIQEYIVTPEAINTVFIDGGVVDSDPVGAGNPNFDSYNNVYTVAFGREKTPTYRFDYTLSNAYFGIDTDYLHVEYAGGDLTEEEQSEYFSIDIVEGEGVSIEFFPAAPPKEYLFNVYYEFGFTEGVETYLFEPGNWISWHLDLTSLSITKDKNIRSYIENATFITETMLTTIDTLLSVDRITAATYAVLRESTDREIVCLPNGIHYNEHDYSSDNIYNHRSLIYMIGLVSRTNITSYKPIFTLPEDALIYRTAKFSYTPYAYYDQYNQVQIEYFYVSEDQSMILDSDLNGISPTGTAEEFSYLGEDYSALRYFPYTYGAMQTAYFYANSDASIVLNNDLQEVSATGDMHEFVYSGTTYSAYEYTSYTYSNGSPQTAYFYVRTDGEKILNSSGSEIVFTGDQYRFTSLDVEYIFKNVYSLREYTYNTSLKQSFYVSDNGIWYKDLNKSSITVVGTKDDFVYNNIRYTYNDTDVVYRYTPYTTVDENNVMQNVVFLVNEAGTDFKDITGQDVTFVSGDYDEFVLNVGGNNKTYTISRTDGIPGLDYTFERNVYTYTDGVDTFEKEFYVSLDGTIIQNEQRKNIVITSGDRLAFVYNGVTYTLQTVLETANYTFENFSLEADYNPQSGAKGIEFNYIRYRVYSEKYEDDQSSLYYTDYKIAIQDITNNVRFDITIHFDEGIALSSSLNNFRLFLELINKAKDRNLTSWTTEDDFILNNRMGLFATYTYDPVDPNAYLDHGTFTTNTSGGYVIGIDMPKEYTFSYTIYDPTHVNEQGEEIPITGNEENDFVILGDALLSRIVRLDIVIETTTPPVMDWGQHLETDLLEPYSENSPNVN